MKFHDTWSLRCFHLREITWYVNYQTLKNHWNLQFMKLPMLKLWQNSLIRKNCSTFIVLTSTILSISMHDIEKRDTAFLLHRHLTICFLVSIAFQELFCGVAVLYWKWFITPQQGARKVIFKACHSGKLKLAYTSPNVISTSPKNISMSRIDFTVLL